MRCDDKCSIYQDAYGDTQCLVHGEVETSIKPWDKTNKIEKDSYSWIYPNMESTIKAMYYQRGYTLTEISEILSMPLSTVNKRVKAS